MKRYEETKVILLYGLKDLREIQTMIKNTFGKEFDVMDDYGYGQNSFHQVDCMDVVNRQEEIEEALEDEYASFDDYMAALALKGEIPEGEYIFLISW